MFQNINIGESGRSTVSRESPTKLPIDLQQARRLHRSRIQSIQNIRLDRITKNRIYQDIYQLETSWNEYQFQRSHQLVSQSKNKSRSKTKHLIKEDNSQHPKGLQLVSKPQMQSTQTPKKVPHRTQIYLNTQPKKQDTFSEWIKDISNSDFKIRTPSNKNLFQTTPKSRQKFAYGYHSKLGGSYLTPTPHKVQQTPKRQKPIHNAFTPSKPTKQRTANVELKFQSPRKANHKIDPKVKTQIFEAVAKQIKKMTIKRCLNTKQIAESQFEKPSSKVNTCNLQIQNILFQQHN